MLSFKSSRFFLRKFLFVSIMIVCHYSDSFAITVPRVTTSAPKSSVANTNEQSADFIKLEEITITSMDQQPRCHLNESEIKKMATQFSIIQHDKLNPRTHTVSRHIAKDDDYLLDRLLHSSNSANSATTYRNHNVADHLIAKVLHQDAKRIADWLNNNDTKNILSLDYQASANIGTGIKRDKNKFETKYFRIVMKKKDCSLNIITSYPVAMHDLKQSRTGSGSIVAKSSTSLSQE